MLFQNQYFLSKTKLEVQIRRMTKISKSPFIYPLKILSASFTLIFKWLYITEYPSYVSPNSSSDKILKISFIYPPNFLSLFYRLIFNRLYLKKRRPPTQSPNQVGSLSKFPSPHLFRYLLYYPVYVKCLSRCLSSPPIAVICREYYFSIFSKQFSHVGSYKPPFQDLAALIDVLEIVQ